MRTTFFSCTALFCSLLAFGCTDTSSFSPLEPIEGRFDPIVNGIEDNNARNDNVVSVWLAGHFICTGSLIAPNVVLTARHCVSDTGDGGVTCDNDVQGNYAARYFEVKLGPKPTSETSGYDVKSIVSYDTNEICNEDVALLVLKRNVTSVAPLPVRVHKNVARGERFRAIGYGNRDEGYNPPSGERYYRDRIRRPDRKSVV